MITGLSLANMSPFSKFLSPKPKEIIKLHSPFSSSTTLVLNPDREAQRRDGTTATRTDTNEAVQSDQDTPTASDDEYTEDDAAQYLRFSRYRKISIVIILTYCSFLAPVASTAVIAAVPEVAKNFNTTGDIIDASNALYLAFMGISSTFWGPFSQVWGRRPVSHNPKAESPAIF